MAHDVCPWWLGYWLASPVRKWMYRPSSILAPFVREGMTIYEPGPGMGFFTLEMARLVGPKGRIVVVDIQPQMVGALVRKAVRKGVSGRIEARLATPTDMQIGDLRGKTDFVLAFSVVHEMPDQQKFFKESFACLRHGGKLLFSEPANHVDQDEFKESLNLAAEAGFLVESTPIVKSSLSALLVKK